MSAASSQSAEGAKVDRCCIFFLFYRIFLIFLAKSLSPDPSFLIWHAKLNIWTEKTKLPLKGDSQWVYVQWAKLVIIGESARLLQPHGEVATNVPTPPRQLLTACAQKAEMNPDDAAIQAACNAWFIIDSCGSKTVFFFPKATQFFFLTSLLLKLWFAIILNICPAKIYTN